jgi:hypothetical protein
MLLVFAAVVRALVGEAVHRDESAVQDGVGQPSCSDRGGMYIISQRCRQVHAFTDVTPSRSGADGESGSQTGIGVAGTQASRACWDGVSFRHRERRSTRWLRVSSTRRIRVWLDSGIEAR